MTVTLSHSMTSVASGDVKAVDLPASVVVGKFKDGFDQITDLAVLPEEHLAILDRVRRVIDIVDSNGAMAGQVGRQGDGPGEFRSPVALVGAGAGLVVLQSLTVNTLTSIAVSGSTPPLAIGAPVAGDWDMVTYRSPDILLGAPFQTGPEDWTRRIAPLADSGFVLMVQESELTALAKTSTPDTAPPAYLIRLNGLLQVLDTIATLKGAPTQYKAKLNPKQTAPTMVQALYSARPVWAVGDGWLAVGNGRDRRVEIRSLSSDSAPRLVIEWPAGSREVTKEERRTTTEWIADYTARSSPEAQKASDAMSKSERSAAIAGFASILPFETRTPEVVAAYGAGRCLWLSGFAPADHLDATGLTLVVIDALDGTLKGVVRIPRKGSRIRDVSVSHLYSSYFDDDGVAHLERFDASQLGCRAQ